MADTSRDDFGPDAVCDDCGKKGNVAFKHWGCLIPPGSVAHLCRECMLLRGKAEEIEPLGYRKKFCQCPGEERHDGLRPGKVGDVCAKCGLPEKLETITCI